MKTWIDLLGSDQTNCVVDERYISRHLGDDHYIVLMDCESPEMAVAVMQAWQAELYQGAI